MYKKKKLKTKKAMLGMMMLGKTMKDEKKPMPVGVGGTMLKLDFMKKMLGMKHGGMSKARGTGCAVKGTKFKGIF